MLMTQDARRELLWDVLRKSVALGEQFYGTGEQQDYLQELGVNFGYLCHHYIVVEGSGEQSSDLQRDPFYVMKRFFEGMGDTIRTASMEPGHYVAQLHSPSTSLLFTDNRNYEAFFAGFAGSLMALHHQFCSVKIRHVKEARTFFISIVCGRDREVLEQGGYIFHKDSLLREKPSSYNLIVSTLNFLLHRQGFQDRLEEAGEHQGTSMNERKFKLLAILLRLAIENDRLARKNGDCTLELEQYRKSNEKTRESVCRRDAELESLRAAIQSIREDSARKEQQYLARIGDLEEKLARSSKEASEKGRSLEKARREIKEMKEYQENQDRRFNEKTFDDLLSIISQQKETIARQERALQNHPLRGQEMQLFAGHPQLRRDDLIDDVESLDDYHYYLMDYCERLADENRCLKETAVVDEVTGSFNARYLMRRLEEELNRVRRHRRNLSLIKIGINNFHHIIRSYDDDLAHRVLLEVTRNMRESLRNIDIITRTGDDEFVILLPETALEHALVVAQRLSENLRSLSLNGSQGNYVHVSVSGSVLCFDDYELPGAELIRAAEDLLLHGKTVNVGNLKLKEVHTAPVYYIN